MVVMEAAADMTAGGVVTVTEDLLAAWRVACIKVFPSRITEVLTMSREHLISLSLVFHCLALYNLVQPPMSCQ